MSNGNSINNQVNNGAIELIFVDYDREASRSS